MNGKKILEEIKENIGEVIAQKSDIGKSLMQAFKDVHPADISDFLESIAQEDAEQLYIALPKNTRLAVFEELTDRMKVKLLALLNELEQVEAFNSLSADELTDLFDLMSDEELKKYLNLLHKRVREKVIALLKFDPESAGGVMHTDVITLPEEFTVEKSVKILQRLSPSQDIHQSIFVIDKDHRLVGFVKLEDLVFQKPQTRISEFMHKPELVAKADEDREKIAKEMVHYGQMIVPVVDEDNHFLGVISGDTLVDVLVEEAAEDVYKMSGTPVTRQYFEVPFFRLLYERCYILLALLLTESFSRTILGVYEATLTTFLLSFIPMLISAGGNTSNQTSAVVLQGLASGELNFANMRRFIRREFIMGFMLASILGIVSFIRVYISSGYTWESLAISISVSTIVLISVSLGSAIPFILRRFNVDPAFFAGPFLATVMDIFGVLVYCYIVKLILF